MRSRPCSPATSGRAAELPDIDATFVFASDVHACRMGSGLSPSCAAEGKTDENLRRHIAAINRLPELRWPARVGGKPAGLVSAGARIGRLLGVVIGGDMTDDGGGQVVQPGEGTQLMQFSHRYQEGPGPDRIHFPVYVGLGNHDLDQDGPPQQVDWYRRELRDYVELNHRPSVIFKPPVPAGNYDLASDDYSWDFGGLHLVQAHRFAGDRSKGAASGIPWLKQDLAANAADGRPVILFQHYGWDSFSIERWDPSGGSYSDTGSGPPHWWSDDDRQELLAALAGYNVIGIFHGDQHETPMIYRKNDLDMFKPIGQLHGRHCAGARHLDLHGCRAGRRACTTWRHRLHRRFSKPISVARR